MKFLSIAVLICLVQSKKVKHRKHKAVGEVKDQYEFFKVTQFKGQPIPMAVQYYSPTSTQVVLPTYSIQSTFVPERPRADSTKDGNFSMVAPYVYSSSKHYQVLNNPYNDKALDYYAPLKDDKKSRK